jgi:hypothetical protein
MSRFAFLVLPLLSGCMIHETPFGFMADKTSDWYETGPVRKPHEEIARTIRELLLRQGYATPEFDGVSEGIQTGWDVHLSTRWREGYRTKIDAEIVPVGTGAFNVRVRSWMELNDNVVHPGIGEQATWVGAGVSDKHKSSIPEPAIKLHTLLKNRFFGLNP